MTRRKALSIGLACLLAAMVVVGASFMAACGEGDGEETTYTFEAENAVLWTESGDYGGDAYSGALGVDVSTLDSGGMAIGGFMSVDSGYRSDYNDTITFNIHSNKAVEGVTLTIVAASSVMDWNTFNWATFECGYLELDMSQDDYLSVNGKNVRINGILPGTEESNFRNWAEITVSVDLVKGDNEIVFTAGQDQFNFDCIRITTSAKLTWTETDNTDKLIES